MLQHARIRTLAANGLEATPLGRLCRWTASQLFGGFILAFHRSSGRSLIEQVEALESSRLVTLDEMVTRLENGRSTSGLFSITVDDGIASTVKEYCHIARERQWPMTFFLPTSYLDRGSLPFQVVANLENNCPSVEVRLGDRVVDLTTDGARRSFFAELMERVRTARETDYMPLVDRLIEHLTSNGLVSESAIFDVAPPISWADVERLAGEEVLSFQSHGVSHQAVASLDAPELREELVRSRELIEERTNRPVVHFCYPYGGPESIGQCAPRIVGEVFSSSVTMTRGRLRRSDPLLLPRIPLYEQDTGNVARLKVVTA